MPAVTRAQTVAIANKEKARKLAWAKGAPESKAQQKIEYAATIKKQQAIIRKEFNDWLKARPRGERTKSQLREEMTAYLEATEQGYRNVEILVFLSPRGKGSKISAKKNAEILNDVYNRPDGWD
ncbi:hypothetical protein LTR56_005824 [Elasticomyces elasticus]|nr:hypothetical protein LTR22_019419 [Elasticomyces elasticus]KAK3651367.1 hypothetical protein LTR56_005824 [Elasticomyces elasticus]KAK4925755.1 hypothetical protein LTR49_007365 [Elasticomyces elasticus]KAK5765087.1 hypothetical protein LTS12_004865 [Elasticomyces elasticus]